MPIREEVRRLINDRILTDFIPLEHPRGAAKDFYICPVCGSGTGRKKTPGLKLFTDTKRVLCFAGKCFSEKGEDTLGALRIIWNCSEAEAIARAGYTQDSTPTPQPKRREAPKEKENVEIVDYSSFYRQAQKDLQSSSEALNYLHGRGITDESIERFGLGYCAEWKHSKAPEKAPATKRIIIPRTNETFTARRIDKPVNEYEERYAKQVEGHQRDLFNLNAIDEGVLSWIVEGELDAISLYQAGASSVIGLGSVVNAARLVEEAKKRPSRVYIIALDGDKAGRDAQSKIVEEMNGAGILGLDVDTLKFYVDAKDANEAWTKNPDLLRKLVNGLEGRALQEKAARDEKRNAELEKRTGTGMLDAFLQTVRTRDFEPIPTGIADIDRATYGGFTRRTLVLLSGGPGLGKTCLAQAITENIAKTGRDCLFLNLEMDRNQLLARSLARIAWTEYDADVSPLQILRGYSWTDEQAESITKAIEKYRAEIAPRMIYNPDELTNSIDSILQVMASETVRVKAEGRAEPIVVIDYLNLIDSGNKDAVEGLKNVIYRLKDFAKRNNTVVIAVTATNRASNKTGTVDMESGRDTSAVEYSGDLMLGLSYTAIEDGRMFDTGEVVQKGQNKGDPIFAKYDLDYIRKLRREAYDKGMEPPSVCTEISLKVLKNRFGEPERRAKLHFDGKHNLYTMAYTEVESLRGMGWEEILPPPRKGKIIAK